MSKFWLPELMAWSDRKLRRRDGRTRPTGFPGKLIPLISASDSVLLSKYIPCFSMQFFIRQHFVGNYGGKVGMGGPRPIQAFAAPLGNAAAAAAKVT